MNNNRTGFCRLCAELKRQIELTDLQTDETAREEVHNKLTRLSCHLDFNKNNLPLTVCSKCLNTLNCAFDFVVSVQSAQLELTLVEAVKLEIVSSDNESVACKSPYENSDDDVGEIASSLNVILDDGTYVSIKPEEKVTSTALQTVEPNTISEEGNLNKYSLDSAPIKSVQLEIFRTDNERVTYKSPYKNSNVEDGETVKSGDVILDDGTNSNNNPIGEQNTISQEGNKKEDLLDPAVKLEIVSSDNESVAYESPYEYSNADDSETECSSDEILDDVIDSHYKLEDKVTSTAPQTLEQSTISQDDKQKADVLDPALIVKPKLTWSDYKWTCAYCDIQYSNLFELKAHSMEYHQACNAFSCADCKSRYLRFDNFIRHICEHRKYLKLTCLKCREQFNTVRGLNRHQFSHFVYKYKCDGCNSCFASSYKLHKHMKIYYKNGSSRYLRGEPQPDDLVCPICKKKLRSKNSYNSHKLIHTDRKRDYTCDVCGKSYTTKGNLKHHITTHDKAKPFMCDICKSVFKTKKNLRNHILLHYSYINAFPCGKCEKSFCTQSQLKNHSIVHTDSFPYVCSYCKKGFKFKTVLTVHLRQHTGEKPYSCDACNKDFTNWSNYNKHKKRIHNQPAVKKNRLKKIIT